MFLHQNMIQERLSMHSLLFFNLHCKQFNFSLQEPLKSPYIQEVTIESLYLLMGRELEELDEVPAGNIAG